MCNSIPGQLWNRTDKGGKEGETKGKRERRTHTQEKREQNSQLLTVSDKV